MNMPFETKLRMSLIARATMYTDVDVRRDGFRAKAAITAMLPRKPAKAKIVHDVNSKLTRVMLRGRSSNDDIVFTFSLFFSKSANKTN